MPRASPGSSCVKGPLRSFTVNKQCLNSCLVFCPYGCYSSGRPAPWAPGALPGLVAVSPSETGPGPGLWTGPLASSLAPVPPLGRAWSPSLLSLPHHAQMGGCDIFLPGSSLEATELTELGCTEATWHQPGPAGRGFRCPHLPHLPALPGQDPAGTPDHHAGELSDTEALSSSSLAPRCSHQQVLLIQVQGHHR